MTPSGGETIRGITQADATTAQRFGGTALGLAITRKLAHDGRRRDRSHPAGQGLSLHGAAASSGGLTRIALADHVCTRRKRTCDGQGGGPDVDPERSLIARRSIAAMHFW